MTSLHSNKPWLALAAGVAVVATLPWLVSEFATSVLLSCLMYIALARPADQYRLGDVVRALEDNPSLIDCGAPPCVLARNCQLKSALDDALQAFFERLNRYTLADAVRAPTGLSIVSLQRRGAVLPVAV